MKINKKILTAVAAVFLGSIALEGYAATNITIDKTAISKYTNYDESGNVAVYNENPDKGLANEVPYPSVTLPVNGGLDPIVKQINQHLLDIPKWDHVCKSLANIHDPGVITFTFHAKSGLGLIDKTCTIQFKQSEIKANRTISLPSCSIQ